jgi:transaldolase / glucose-6-phosphate isomerase
VIQKRLGWLNLPKESQILIPSLTKLMEECKAEGYEKVILLGMGGSSLAPETISLILGEELDGLSLIILDSTISEQITAAEDWIDFDKTLFIVASKSGTTLESLSLFSYFWAKAEKELGDDRSPHFVAITDPGSKLAVLGESLGFRAVFTTNPNVGGRFSALTYFGLVPAALLGVNLEKFLGRAAEVARNYSQNQDIELNLGALLGIILGVAANRGKDKLTFLTDESLRPMSAWLEQLVAESSGKEGRGIVPVADEPMVDPKLYGSDRVFVYLRISGELDEFIKKLQNTGHIVVILNHPDIYSLAEQFYIWEFAIAIACSVIGVNAFDQPDVQDSKDRTKKKIIKYLEEGCLAEPDVIWEKDSVKIFGFNFKGLADCKNVEDVVDTFTALSDDGDFIAINAYVARNKVMYEKFQALREQLLKKTGRATTLGFGPRFLHSTGQLHKGGPNNGLFLQITQEESEDLNIPGEDYSFSVVAQAQAEGDLEALLSRDRRAIRIHFQADDPLEF